MSAITLLIILFPILMAAVALVVLRRQARGAEQVKLWQANVRAPRPAHHQPQPIYTQDQEQHPAERFPDSIPYYKTIVRSSVVRSIVIAVLLVLLFLYIISRTLTPRLDDFIVLVAPFRDQGAEVTQTGRSAAQHLVEILPAQSGRRVRVISLQQPPVNDADALNLLESNGADVLVWGEITPGALLDSESLLPRIAYSPSGGFAPNAWLGYTGRFALPNIYTIADYPINGEVVLPQLFLALADYSDNRPDTTVAILNQLQSNYPALNPVLPNIVLGTIEWARSEYPNSVKAYQVALNANQRGDARTQAILFNNLGAVLQDAGDIRARDAFNQAVAILNSSNGDLAELRFNLAQEAFNARDYDLAALSLEYAYALHPPSGNVLLELSREYLLTGRTDPIQNEKKVPALGRIISDIEGQIVVDLDRSPADLRDVEGDRLHASATFIQSLQSLSQASGLKGPLFWKLEARDNLNQSVLGSVVDDLNQASTLAERRVKRWSERATAFDAAGNTIAGQIAIHQARLAERDQHLFQKWQVVAMLELAQSQNARPLEGVAGVWSRIRGNTAKISELQQKVEQLMKTDQQDAELTMLHGYTLLAEDKYDAAADTFKFARVQLPQNPEPSFGLAQVALQNTNIPESERYAQGQALLQQAIAQDERYFPARIVLAAIAEEQGSWQLAIEQRRRLYEEQPSDATTLALARTLRQSEPPNPVEAEQILLPLANENSVDALIELSKVYGVARNIEAMHSVLEQAQRVEPRNVEVAYALGMLAMQSNPPDPSEAERQFRLALTSNNRHVPSLLRLAELHAANSKNSTDFYKRALDAGADDVPTLINIGSNLLAHQEPKLARDAFTRAAKADGNNAIAQWGLAEANLHLNDLNASQEAAQKALALRANTFPEAQVILGDVALERGDYTGAEQAYLAAATQNPQLVRSNIGLGRVAVTRGQWSVATGHFRNAVAGEEDMWKPEAYYWLGEALLQQQKLDEALQAYQQAIDMQVDYAEAWFGKAQAYTLYADLAQRQGNSQQAAQYLDQANSQLDQALLYRPKYAEVFLLRGKLFEQSGSQRQALNAYNDAISANGKLSEARYRRALLLIQDNKLGDAQKDLSAAVEAQPTFPEAYYWLGRLAFADSRYQQALEQFKKAVAQADANGLNYAEARFYQGLTEERLGLRDAAIVSIQASLQENTNSSWATEARTALDRLSKP